VEECRGGGIFLNSFLRVAGRVALKLDLKELQRPLVMRIGMEGPPTDPGQRTPAPSPSLQ
jgi:hypothetical protein